MSLSVSKSHGRRFLFNIGGTTDRGAEGADVERQRRENRGAVGADGCGERCPSPETFSIADLKMVSFDAFCVVF